MKTCVKNNAQKSQKRRNKYPNSPGKGVIKLPRNSRNIAYHEAGHTLIGYLLGVGIDYVTIDPEKLAPELFGQTKYTGGETVRRPYVLSQMLFIAGILGQDHPGQKPEELLVAADDLENCPYVGDESRDSYFLDWHFNKKCPDLAKYCDVDRTVQDRIGVCV